MKGGGPRPRLKSSRLPFRESHQLAGGPLCAPLHDNYCLAAEIPNRGLMEILRSWDTEKAPGCRRIKMSEGRMFCSTLTPSAVTHVGEISWTSSSSGNTPNMCVCGWWIVTASSPLPGPPPPPLPPVLRVLQ